jgi:undecaprenyl-diphosphatase
MILISFGITDYLGGHIIKDAIGRIRPCGELTNVHLLVGCAGGKSFPSLHAANNFGIALILSRYFRSKTWIFYTLASLIALSRVFVGVHYPLDILGGAVMGSLTSIIIIFLFEKIRIFRLKSFSK